MLYSINYSLRHVTTRHNTSGPSERKKIQVILCHSDPRTFKYKLLFFCVKIKYGKTGRKSQRTHDLISFPLFLGDKEENWYYRTFLTTMLTLLARLTTPVSFSRQNQTKQKREFISNRDSDLYFIFLSASDTVSKLITLFMIS